MTESRLLRISNRYKSDGGSMGDFISCFSDTATYSCQKFEISSFQMHRLYPHIWEPVNTVVTSKGTFRVPPGQYDADSLCSVLTEMGVGLSFTMAAGYMVMTANEANVAWYGTQSTIARLVGEQRDISLYTLGQQWIMIERPDLAGPELFLQLPSLMHSLCSESSGNANTSFIPLLCSIPTNTTEFGQEIFFSPAHPIVFETQNSFSLNCIRVQLTDSWGNVLAIPNNCYLNLIIKYYF